MCKYIEDIKESAPENVDVPSVSVPQCSKSDAGQALCASVGNVSIQESELHAATPQSLPSCRPVIKYREYQRSLRGLPGIR